MRRQHFALDWVLRKWLKEPGVALFYEGQTVADGKNVEQVTVMNAHNEGVTLYLDFSDHLPIKKTFTWRDPTDKQRNVEDEVYDNYRVIQGIPTPYTVTRFYNGDMSGQRFITSVSYNQGSATPSSLLRWEASEQNPIHAGPHRARIPLNFVKSW